MQTKKQNDRSVPNLRFKGFEGEWEKKKLGEMVRNISSGKSTDKNIGGENPFYGSTGIIAYSNQFDYSGEKILIARVGANAGSLYKVSGNYSVSDNTLILDLKDEIEIDFAYNYLIKKNLNKLVFGSGQPLITGGQLKLLELFFPSINEEIKIADFLSVCNARIQTQNKIIEELKLLKAEISKKVFTQQLRFKDDKGNNFGDWALKKLGEITVAVNKRNKNNEKLTVYSINNKLGFVPQDEQFEGIDSEERGYDITLYKIIDRHTFAYNPARINIGSIGYSGDLGNIIISSLYVCFKTTSDVNDDFLFQYLKTDLFNKEVLKSVEGGVREYLFYENFSKIKLNLPCREEQMKIAAFLSTIDKKTEFEATILNLLAKQKQYLLQQMFI